jgi:hypothetical protein
MERITHNEVMGVLDKGFFTLFFSGRQYHSGWMFSIKCEINYCKKRREKKITICVRRIEDRLTGCKIYEAKIKIVKLSITYDL